RLLERDQQAGADHERRDGGSHQRRSAADHRSPAPGSPAVSGRNSVSSLPRRTRRNRYQSAGASSNIPSAPLIRSATRVASLAAATAPEPSARARKASTMSGCRARIESVARNTAARCAPAATVISPTTTEVGFHQLVSASPPAFPTGTRPEAIPPTAAPRKKG